MANNEHEKRSIPPAQPSYVLRGHREPIHALEFFRDNSRLISGDAEGWIVIWDISIKRPVAVWRAHQKSVLGVAPWGHDRIITHGRDDKLSIWQISKADELILDRILPVDDPYFHRKQPWLLHSIPVNSLNFCSFAMCAEIESAQPAHLVEEKHLQPFPILVAVPHGANSEHIEIYQFPTERRISIISSKKSPGMVMTIGLLYRKQRLTVIVGYENGELRVYERQNLDQGWREIYTAQPHSQPVLSIGIEPSHSAFFSSSADSSVVKHQFPPLDSNIFTQDLQSRMSKVRVTKHSGQQGLSTRSDGKIFATAGWDAKIRVYSTKSLSELAVLKWHKEGCYTTAFAAVGLGESLPITPHALQSDSTAQLAADKYVSIFQSASIVHRSERVKAVHWLAAGSKDGKISLWDIY